MNEGTGIYPPIADYALISNCRCAALISKAGSVDWCCVPRFDEDSTFGRLLDWNLGGYWSMSPCAASGVTRHYLPGTMILETCFRTDTGSVRLTDFFLMGDGEAQHEMHDLVRLVEGTEGYVDLRTEIRPRFDYGEIAPRTRAYDEQVYAAIGSNKGLAIFSDVELEVVSNRDLVSGFRIRAGEKARFVIHFQPPEKIGGKRLMAWRDRMTPDAGFGQTRDWWRGWAGRLHASCDIDEQTRRSATVLKSLTYAQTGAIIAAPTTSLPEWIGGGRNWDYRYSWVRDSVFVVRALHQLGYEKESTAFLRFIQRSTAGSAEELQIMFGVDGKRRLTEVEIDWLEGYRGSRPVRIGNLASEQLQLDVYGEVLELAWEGHTRGKEIDPAYWQFLVEVLDIVCDKWTMPDRGIWERRGKPLHLVYSKAMCWGALDRGLRLATEKNLPAHLERWKESREAIRSAIETEGYDRKRGVFTQAFDDAGMDAALLQLGRIGFVSYHDQRMVRTTDAICATLERDGLILRYDSPDGLHGPEATFLPCTFWLVICLAKQGRKPEAMKYYRRAMQCANDLGLFSEEYDPGAGAMLGNFPQALTHVSQIMAWIALNE